MHCFRRASPRRRAALLERRRLPATTKSSNSTKFLFLYLKRVLTNEMKKASEVTGTG